jgi:hypothetical protein
VGSVIVRPQHTTTYILTASNAAGTVESKPVVVTVHSPTGQPPIIALNLANPQKTSLKSGETIQLCYSIMNAQSARIDPDIGAVGEAGCRPASPKQTTTYVLTATGTDGQTISRKQVTVVVIPRAEVGIRAQRLQLKPGETTQLCWSLANVRTARIDPGIGPIDPPQDGCVTIAPNTSTDYWLTGTGLDGEPFRRRVTVWVSSR